MFSLAGLAAAVGFASCCYLPITLASIGIGAGWLAPIAAVASPNRNVFLVISAVGLLGGAILLIGQQRRAMTCMPGQTCTRPSTRIFTSLMIIAGSGLVWAGYNFV